MSRYYVTGQYPIMFNGVQSYVIVSLGCNSKEEARRVLKDREHIYQHLKIEENNKHV